MKATNHQADAMAALDGSLKSPVESPVTHPEVPVAESL